MKCISCGAEMPDGTKYCSRCGAAQPVQTDNTAVPPQGSQQQNTGGYGNNPGNVYNMPPRYGAFAQPQPVTIGGWIGRMLIPLIPFVGGIIYIIMLFVWMCDSTKDETFRNWAKAQLIISAIKLVLLIFIVAAFGGLVLSAFGTYMYF